jgi:hypothetical protein
MKHNKRIKIGVWILIILSMLSIGYALPGTNIISQIRSFFVNNPDTPFINNLTAVPNINPITGNITYVYINFTATDADGVNTLNDGSATIVFNKSAMQRTGSCTPNDINTITTLYICNVSMWYYDNPGVWSINVSVSDYTGRIASNATTTFIYNTLSSITLNNSQLSFGTIYVRYPQGASNDPILINNTGNVDFTNISLRAFDLVGITYTNYIVRADQFAVSTTDAFNITLQNNTFVNITGITLPYGVAGTQNIYMWVNLTYDIPAQDYTSNVHGAWMIMVE